MVSVLGFLVNLIGIYAFQHGGAHGHSHGGGSSHSHSHSHNSHSIHHEKGESLILTINIFLINNFSFIEVLLNNHHGHSHDDSHHGHSHTGDLQNSQIMRGVFLHILADTLGSVGVIISAVLMHLFGWMIADPICSMFIAIMIALSVFSLIKESGMILMQRTPLSLDWALPGCYQKVTGLAGVYSVQEPHFWTLSSEYFVGAIKLEVSKNVDPKYVITHTRMIFEAVGVRQIYIQLDYAPM